MGFSVTNNKSVEVYQKEQLVSNKGKLLARDVKLIPASHDGSDAIKVALIAAGIIFLLSIVFWAVGASTNIAGLEIVGKIFFSLTICTAGIIGIGFLVYLCMESRGSSASVSFNIRA